MRRRVVHAPQEHVFERQPPARRLPVAVGRRDHVGQADRLVDRHEPRAELVVGRMQTHGQMVAGVGGGEPVDARGQADGRDRDPPLRDAEPLRILGLGKRGQEAVEIGQRLAHPHHHDVAEPLLGREQRRQPQQLLDDLARGQVPHHAVDAAGAEHAAHRTAHLRTDAHGPPVAVAEQHALDPLAVGELQEQLLGAVVGPLVHRDGGRPDPEVGIEVGPQVAGQVGHVGERRRPAAVQPTADRRSPPSGLAPLAEPGRETRRRVEHVPQRGGRGLDDGEECGIGGHRKGGIGTGGCRERGVHFGWCRIIARRPAVRVEAPSMNQKNYNERTQWVYDDRAFPVWNGSFDKSDRVEMIDEDLWAGRSISVLLAVLVAIGLALALGTLWFVSNWR